MASSASGDPQNEPREDTDAADGTPGGSAPDEKKNRAAEARTEAESRRSAARSPNEVRAEQSGARGGKTEPAAPKTTQGQKGRDNGSPWRMMGLGLQLTVAVLVFLAAGRWVDEKLGWTPWGQTVLGMLGVAAGLYWMLKDADR